MNPIITDLFAQAALEGAGQLAGGGLRMGGRLAMAGLRKTPLKRFLPKQSKVANEPPQ